VFVDTKKTHHRKINEFGKFKKKNVKHKTLKLFLFNMNSISKRNCILQYNLQLKYNLLIYVHYIIYNLIILIE